MQTDIADKVPIRTLGIQTPVLGPGYKSKASFITTSEIITAEIKSSSLIDITADDTTKSKLFSAYGIFNERVWGEFCTEVGNLLDDMVLIDTHANAKQRIRDMVGMNHFITRRHFIDALYDVCSFEFLIWCRYLESIEKKPRTCDLGDLEEISVTLEFMDRYFGIDTRYQ